MAKFKYLLLLMLISLLSGLLTYSKSQTVHDEGKDAYQIRLVSRAFTPKADISVLKGMKSLKGDRHHVILQFKSSLRLSDYKLLSDESIYLLEYLHGNAYIASVPTRPEADKVSFVSLLRWAGEIEPGDKLQYHLAKDRLYDWTVDSKSETLNLLVQFYRDVSEKDAAAALASVGAKGKPYGATNSWSARLKKADLTTLAAHPLVKMIEQGPLPFLPLNEKGRRRANTELALQETWGPIRPDYRVSGAGVRVGICDTGIDENYNDFKDPWGVLRIYNSREGSGLHGTIMASIVGGNGVNSESNGLPAYVRHGHAPRALLGDYPKFSGDVGMYFGAIVDDGTDITNHSYVQSGPGYIVKSADLDKIVRGAAVVGGITIPARPQVWAAGNNGVSSSTCTFDETGYYSVSTAAKNPISVGAVHADFGQLVELSALGPTFDGRIKPDLVAPTNVMAANDSTQEYTLAGGTSSAAPVVSAVIALMMDQYEEEFDTWPQLHPSTYKAILLHTARDQIKIEPYANAREWTNPDLGGPVKFFEGPDFATGYGLVDADAAVNKIAEDDQWMEAVITGTGDVHRYCMTIEEGSGPLKVLIAWDDREGSASSEMTVPKLVNDLDLVLRDPNGAEFHPWTLDPLPLTADVGSGDLDPISYNDLVPAHRGVDRRNNVEMVSVCGPAAGDWEIEITAHDLPFGEVQPYSVVASDDFGACFRGSPFGGMMPWLREIVVLQAPPTLVKPDIFEVEIDNSIVAIDKICQFVLNCPGCYGPAWSYCPGMEITLEGLGQEIIATVFNEKGELRAKDSSGGRVRKIAVEKIRPGEQLYIALSDPAGKPILKTMNLKFQFEELK